VWRLSFLVAAAAGCGRSGFEQVIDAQTIDAHLIDAPRTYRDAVLAAHPLAYWRFGDPDTMVRDELGGPPGSFTGGCTAGAAGALANDANSAMALDGTCRILLGTGFEFDGNAPYAIEVWIHTSQNTIFQQVFGRESRDTQNPIDGYELVVAPTGIELERAIAGANNKTTMAPFATDRFVHVVAQYTGTTQQMWLDGTLAAQSIDARAIVAYAAPALAGASTMGNFLTGSLDELAVYDRALDPSEIALHAAYGAH